MPNTYICGDFDLPTHAQFDFLRQLSKDNASLVVGVYSDEDCQHLTLKPVLPYEARLQILRLAKIASRIITAPLFPSREFYQFYDIKKHLIVKGYPTLADGMSELHQVVSSPDNSQYLQAFKRLSDLGLQEPDTILYRIRANQANLSWYLSMRGKAYVLKYLLASDLENFVRTHPHADVLCGNFVFYPYISGTSPYRPRASEVIALLDSYEAIDKTQVVGYDLPLRCRLLELEDSEISPFIAKHRDFIEECLVRSDWYFCHCDFDSANFVMQSDGVLRLIDWEFAMYAPLECDIACAVTRGLLDIGAVGDIIDKLGAFKHLTAPEREQRVKFTLTLAVLFAYATYQWIKRRPRPDSIAKGDDVHAGTVEFLYQTFQSVLRYHNMVGLFRH